MSSKFALAVESSNIYTTKGEQAAAKFINEQLPNYTLNPKLSDNNSTVLHDAKDKNIIIAYRGTLLNNPKDLKDDFLISLGVPKVVETKRLYEANRKFERVRELYPDNKIIASGHSLGGVESYHVATKNNIEGHHYNIGSGPIDKYINTVQNLKNSGKESYEKQNIYHADRYKALNNIFIGEDPLSKNSKYLTGQHHIIKVNTPTTLDAHDLHHFYKLKSAEVSKPPILNNPISGKTGNRNISDIPEGNDLKIKKKYLNKSI